MASLFDSGYYTYSGWSASTSTCVNPLTGSISRGNINVKSSNNLLPVIIDEKLLKDLVYKTNDDYQLQNVLVSINSYKETYKQIPQMIKALDKSYSYIKNEINGRQERREFLRLSNLTFKEKLEKEIDDWCKGILND